MGKRRQELIAELIRPPILAAGFVAKAVYMTFFGWWLDPRLQKKANQSLTEDVRFNLPFLFPVGRVAKQPRIRVLPFDYASVEVVWENLLLSFTRGREEVNVLVSPVHAPSVSYELGPLIAALENKHFSDRYRIDGLRDAANLLDSHLEQLNSAFSEQNFPAIKEKLW